MPTQSNKARANEGGANALRAAKAPPSQPSASAHCSEERAGRGVVSVWAVRVRWVFYLRMPFKPKTSWVSILEDLPLRSVGHSIFAIHIP
ncbi:hypothetical protein ElyMa_005877600 [Elysia marginata]|uniref:Uncharacterized protein n=1 Tax=Elysia marginata TaxID=1093978 RepID=A0AAV4G1W5_9GAST|nr:hypothetical protein ElyMa_005877600 [Elysia marginata]